MTTARRTPADGASRRWARRLALLSVLLVPVVALPASAQDGLRVTTPVRLNAEDPTPTRTYQSPILRVHPEEPNTVVAASVDMRQRQCRVMRSRDAGQSWRLLDGTPMADLDDRDCFHTGGTVNQTPIDWGADGRLYYGFTRYPDEGGAQGANMDVMVGRSDDLGDTWNTTVARDSTVEGTEDEPENNRINSLAVERNSGDDDVVYVAWGRLRPHGVVAVSTDGGDSFSDPIRPFSDEIVDELGGEDGEVSTGRPQMHVDQQGTLNMTFRADPGAEDEDGRVVVARTDDQGDTWTWNEVDNQVPTAVWAYPMLSSSADGTLHLVYEAVPDRGEGPGGTRDIYYQRSSDGGDTWTEPTVINDAGPNSLAGQYNANIDVAPNGRIDVVWYDFRNGQERFATDTYYTYSTDGGDTWSDDVRVSDRATSRHVGAWSNDFDMRAPPGLASANDYALTAWSDTRNAGSAGQSQDIYGAAVQHEDLGGSDAVTLPMALAAAGGLFLAGALVLGMALGLRRRGVRPATA
jgi:hypothetical protein